MNFFKNVDYRLFSLKKDNTKILRRIENDYPIVFFCFNAMQNDIERSLLKEVLRRKQMMIIVCMRNPMDAQLVHKKASCLQTYGFRLEQLDQAVRMIGQHSQGNG